MCTEILLIECFFYWISTYISEHALSDENPLPVYQSGWHLGINHWFWGNDMSCWVKLLLLGLPEHLCSQDFLKWILPNRSKGVRGHNRLIARFGNGTLAYFSWWRISQWSKVRCENFDCKEIALTSQFVSLHSSVHLTLNKMLPLWPFRPGGQVQSIILYLRIHKLSIIRYKFDCQTRLGTPHDNSSSAAQCIARAARTLVQGFNTGSVAHPLTQLFEVVARQSRLFKFWGLNRTGYFPSGISSNWFQAYSPVQSAFFSGAQYA